MQTYKLNEDGVLEKYSERPVTEYNYAIFEYEKGEDIRKIEGRSPLVYETLEELKEELNTMFDDGEEDGETTIVVRKMTIYA